jgi:hypothetical protein
MITFIQSASASNALSGGSATSVAFSSNNAAHNLIIVAVTSNDDQTATVSDTQGNTYSSLSQVDNTGFQELQIFYAFNIKAGANTVTASFGLDTNMALAIHEFHGSSSGNIAALDQSSSNTGTGNSQTSNSTATTTKANELLFGVTGGNNFSGSTSTFVKDAAYTQAEKIIGTPTQASILTQYQIVSSTGTYASTTTTTVQKGSSFSWCAEIATFYETTLAPSGSSGFFFGA